MITGEHTGDTVEVIGRMQSEKKAIFSRSSLALLEPRLIKGKLALVSNWCSERRDKYRVINPAGIHVSEYKRSSMCCLLTYSPEHPPPRLRWLSGFRLVRVSRWWCRRAPAPSLFLHRPPTWRASTRMGRWRSLNPKERKRLRNRAKKKCAHDLICCVCALEENQWTEWLSSGSDTATSPTSTVSVRRTSPPTDQKQCCVSLVDVNSSNSRVAAKTNIY